MEYDRLWEGGPVLRQSAGVFRLGTDAVLLGFFVNTFGVKRACDLGTGSGVIALKLAWENRNMKIDAIDIQDNAVELARENMVINKVEDRVNVIKGDIRDYKELFKAGNYDLVVSNPPYFKCGAVIPAADPKVAVARDDRSCSVTQLCEAAAYITRWGGKFCIVQKPENLAETICAMSRAGLEPKRLRFVQHSIKSAPNLFLIEGRRGGKQGISVEAPLVLCDESGEDTDEVKLIYHR